MVRLITTFLSLLLVASQSFATVYLATDFEEFSSFPSSGTISAWGGTSLGTSGGNENPKNQYTPYNSAGVNSGGAYYVSSHNLPELYVRFYAKVDCGTGQCTGGTKFLKLFSKNNGGYANSTMRLVYETGNIEGIAAGNGSTTQNDDGNVMLLDGTAPWSPGVNMNTGTTNYTGDYSGHKDNGWHCYEVYMKFNTNGNSDGAYKIWIDGVLKLHATNVKNRHNSNIREFDYITLGGYSNSSQWTSAFNIRFDDVIISDSYIGPLSTSEPVDGGCGSSNGGTFSTAPTTNLCTSGTASAVSGTTSFSWTCEGINGGDPASCSASLTSGSVSAWLTSGGSILTSGGVVLTPAQ